MADPTSKRLSRATDSPEPVVPVMSIEQRFFCQRQEDHSA